MAIDINLVSQTKQSQSSQSSDDRDIEADNDLLRQIDSVNSDKEIPLGERERFNMAMDKLQADLDQQGVDPEDIVKFVEILEAEFNNKNIEIVD